MHIESPQRKHLCEIDSEAQHLTNGSRTMPYKGGLADKDLGDVQLPWRVLHGVLHLPGELLGAVVHCEVHSQDLVEGAICSGKQTHTAKCSLKLRFSRMSSTR